MKKFLRLVLFPLLLVLVGFAGGIYFGQKLDYKIFSDEPTFLYEQPISFEIKPVSCSTSNSVVDCNSIFDNDEETTWLSSTSTCIGSSLFISFDDSMYIDFLTIDEVVNNTSSNVKELQIEGAFGKKIVVLDTTDDFYEWIDLREVGQDFEITILSLYEENPASSDCGISEVAFYGANYFND